MTLLWFFSVIQLIERVFIFLIASSMRNLRDIEAPAARREGVYIEYMTD